MDIKNESWANGTVSTREFLGEQLKSLNILMFLAVIWKALGK